MRAVGNSEPPDAPHVYASLDEALEAFARFRTLYPVDIAELSVGAKVNARWKTGGTFYPGTVRTVHPGPTYSYDVAFDDGDSRSKIPGSEMCTNQHGCRHRFEIRLGVGRHTVTGKVACHESVQDLPIGEGATRVSGAAGVLTCALGRGRCPRCAASRGSCQWCCGGARRRSAGKHSLIAAASPL